MANYFFDNKERTGGITRAKEEQTGENYTTFKSYLPQWYKGKTAELHKLKIYLDDKLIEEKDFII